MNNRIGTTRAGAAALAACLAAHVSSAQTPSTLTNGTVMDATGTVMVQRGASSVRAGRGTSLQPGDRIFVLEDSSVTFACPGQDAVKVTAAGTFTYGGCSPQSAVAAVPPEPGATGAAATPGAGGTASTVAGSPAPGGGATGIGTGGGTGAVLPAPASPTTPPVVVASSGHGAGTTLGIIGGLAVLAAAGGGGGGGGSGSSPPASP